MNSYIILYKDGVGLFDDYEIIQGNTGIEAITNYLPDHYIGVVKRKRQHETENFIIQKLVRIDGTMYRSGSRYGYKYHHPKIERIM